MFKCVVCGQRTQMVKIKTHSGKQLSVGLCKCGWSNCPSRYLHLLEEIKNTVTFDEVVEGAYFASRNRKAQAAVAASETTEAPKEPEEPKPEE